MIVVIDIFELTTRFNLLVIQIRDAMMTRSAKLNHNYQLPLGIDGQDLEIVDLIKCSKFLVC